jgi:hypothetical protein
MKSRWLTLVVLIAFLTSCQQATWKEFSSGEGTFSILMPGTPTEKTQKVNTQAGAIDMHLFTLVQKGVAYLAIYNDYPEVFVQARNADKMLDGARDGAVSSIQGKLLSELIISLDKYPGREIRIEAPDGKHTIQTRIYLVKNRLYQVGVVTPKEGSFSEDVTKFLDSFKLLEKLTGYTQSEAADNVTVRHFY